MMEEGARAPPASSMSRFSSEKSRKEVKATLSPTRRRGEDPKPKGGATPRAPARCSWFHPTRQLGSRHGRAARERKRWRGRGARRVDHMASILMAHGAFLFPTPSCVRLCPHSPLHRRRLQFKQWQTLSVPKRYPAYPYWCVAAKNTTHSS